MLDLVATFEKFESEYLKFQPSSSATKRRDLSAFLLLDKLQPGAGPIVSAAEHDVFFLDIDCSKLAEVATEEDIQDLVRSGIRYDSLTESLSMFV